MTAWATFLLGCQRGLLGVLAVLMCLVATVSQAAEPRIERIEPLITEGQLTLDLDLTFDLGRVVTEAADRVLVEATLTRRLTYNALTQQWRVATGDLFLPVKSLNEALVVLKQVRGWPVAPSDRFDKNQRYDGRIRMRLDASQLARPLQLEAASRSAWSLASPWAPFDFSIQQAGPNK